MRSFGFFVAFFIISFGHCSSVFIHGVGQTAEIRNFKSRTSRLSLAVPPSPSLLDRPPRLANARSFFFPSLSLRLHSQPPSRRSYQVYTSSSLNDYSEIVSSAIVGSEAHTVRIRFPVPSHSAVIEDTLPFLESFGPDKRGLPFFPFGCYSISAPLSINPPLKR